MQASRKVAVHESAKLAGDPVPARKQVHREDQAQESGDHPGKHRGDQIDHCAHHVADAGGDQLHKLLNPTLPVDGV